MLVVLGRVHVSKITAFRNIVYTVHVISSFTGKYLVVLDAIIG